MSRFLSLDPSSTVLGWAVFQGESLVAWGKMDLTKVDYSFRFQYVVNELIHLVQEYGVEAIAIEDVKAAWRSKYRVRNIAGLQIIFKSIQEWAKGANLPFTAYNPASWKNAVVGSVHGTKELTKANILLRFFGLPDNLTDHEYDAIGIGVYHAAISERLEILQEGQMK